MKSIEITDSNLKETISNSGILVLDFWAPWCGPCKVIGPIVEELANNNNDIIVGKINVDENGISAAAFGIRSIPTIIFFKDGEKIDQISGVISLNRLQDVVNNVKNS